MPTRSHASSNDERVVTARSASSTRAAATASAVRRLRCRPVSSAAMTGTSRRRLTRPISAGSDRSPAPTRACPSAVRSANARDSDPVAVGSRTARPRRQYHEPVVANSRAVRCRARPENSEAPTGRTVGP